jgi:hypothetical protein
LDAGRGGFVLALVVLMLFAISVMGTAGYLMVSTEARMARYGTQGEEALAIARGGLHRFVSEQLGEVADSARYAIGSGEAAVTARRVSVMNPSTYVYFIRSEASVVDPLLPDTPARRVVGGYAFQRRGPVPLHAAMVVGAEELEVDGTVSGDDIGGAVCPGGPAPSIGGGIAEDAIDVDGTLDGSPPSQLWPGGQAQFDSEIGLRWDILTDPAFPVDFEDSAPDFGALPASAYPVVRVNGNGYFGSSWSGRGVLIVTGQFDSSSSFAWDGIVLAGWVDDYISGDIDGILVGGFSTTQPYAEVHAQGDIRYHSCYVSWANASLSYLELIQNTIFEVR